MKIKSPDFHNRGEIPAEFTCDGDNISPTLEIDDVPIEAKSLVLVVDDPDAPNGDWSHWLVWNIDPYITLIPENTTPHGAIEGTTDFGSTGYNGPCPPSGVHRYYFKLFALDDIIDLDSDSDKEVLMDEIEDKVIDQATIIGLYRRS